MMPVLVSSVIEGVYKCLVGVMAKLSSLSNILNHFTQAIFWRRKKWAKIQVKLLSYYAFKIKNAHAKFYDTVDQGLHYAYKDCIVLVLKFIDHQASQT